MTNSYSKTPDGTEWCSHCNGYGSSLKEGSERSTRCAGTGLVVVADPDREGTNGHDPAGLGGHD